MELFLHMLLNFEIIWVISHVIELCNNIIVFWDPLYISNDIKFKLIFIFFELEKRF